MICHTIGCNVPRGHSFKNTVGYFYRIIFQCKNVRSQTLRVKSVHCCLKKIETFFLEPDNIIGHNVYQHRSLFQRICLKLNSIEIAKNEAQILKGVGQYFRSLCIVALDSLHSKSKKNIEKSIFKLLIKLIT